MAGGRRNSYSATPLHTCVKVKQDAETFPIMVDSNFIIQDKRAKASDLARRSSDDFCETYGDSALDSIAPFERDEIILGRRVGSGSFSHVYEIEAFNLRPDRSDAYTEEQVKHREVTAKSVKNGARYVMKCLKGELEESDDEDLFLDAAQDIVHEAEMLAALSHPNIIKLHGVTAGRHDAFLDGASEFFIILERLENTLADKIKVWTKENNSFKPSRSLQSLSRSFSSSSLGRNVSSSSLSSYSDLVDNIDIEKATTSAEKDKGGHLNHRLRVAVSLASAVEYLHSQGVIFRDLKPANVGFDKHDNLKLFDFGLSQFMPQRSNCYEDVYKMGGAGTARYAAPEVFFDEPYNLKAEVYSFSVMLWELVSLKKPFAKFKYRSEFGEAYSRVDTLIIVNRKWPQPVQDIITRSLSRDLSKRPTMSEVSKALKECISIGAYDFDSEGKVSTQKQVLPARRSPSKRVFRKFGSSLNSALSLSASITKDYLSASMMKEDYMFNVSEGAETASDTCEDVLLEQLRDELLEGIVF
jgi:serine/threonine protein kinase